MILGADLLIGHHFTFGHVPLIGMLAVGSGASEISGAGGGSALVHRCSQIRAAKQSECGGLDSDGQGWGRGWADGADQLFGSNSNAVDSHRAMVEIEISFFSGETAGKQLPASRVW
jgi:hypothetical protein